jgi:hypothetical protein
MNSEATVRLLPLAVLTVLLAACAKPPPPPTLTLAGRNCVEKPDLASATSVPLADDKPIKVTLDDKAPCVDAPGSGKAAYAVFSLPVSNDEYMLSVTSVPVGEGRFLPRLVLADGDGKALRDIPPDMFMAHGTALRAGLRPHPGERFLIVSSDPDTIGQSRSQIVEGTQVSTSPVGTAGYIQIHTGFENNVTLTNAYNGTVIVAAQPIPKAK